MKRIVSILLLLSCILVGCSTLPAPPTTEPSISTEVTNFVTSPSTETLPAATDYVPMQETMYAVSMPATSHIETAADGNIIFQYICQTPYLTIPDADVAEKITIDLLARIDATHSEAETLRNAAEAAFTNTSDWSAYLYQFTLSPTRIDPGVLSFFGLNTQYSGASHPEKTTSAANYDILTGDVLTLAGILAPGASANSFCKLVISELTENKDNLKLYDFFEETVQDRFAADPTKDENFYFTPEGLCFFFEPMELAPYTAGVIHVQIPYDHLTGLLYDGYFPEELDAPIGSVFAKLQSDVNIEQFTQIGELTLDNEAERIFLYTNLSVRHVRIEAGTWDMLGLSFSPSYAAFAAYGLTPGDAIMLETFIPDTMPNLRLSYQSQNNTIQHFISQSGKDGSIILYE